MRPSNTYFFSDNQIEINDIYFLKFQSVFCRDFTNHDNPVQTKRKQKMREMMRGLD
jgi:hypothetical protein